MRLIPKKDIDKISEAIRAAVNKHGHPDDIPITALTEAGIEQETADKCFALLTSEDFPSNPGQATAKWLRLIGEFSA